MRKAIFYLLIFILLLIIPSGVRYLRFYEFGGEDRQPPPTYDPADIAAVPTPPANRFVDNPTMGDGLVLLDNAHGNQFSLDEIGYLDGRLAARGFEMLPFTEGDLATMLRSVNSFVVIAPTVEFSLDEILAVQRFVDGGGHLLLIGDPSRFAIEIEEDEFFGFIQTIATSEIPLNSLANEFDIIFNGDYLYNTLESEGNFKNILLTEKGFAETTLTEGLETLAFYGSNSLQVGPTATAVITADDNTWSSATDRPGGLVLAATSQDARVLAFGDIHFLAEPYYTVLDNSAWIAHIADFLVDSQAKSLQLTDFPYFYRQPVNLIYTNAPQLGPDAFDEIISLQTAFEQVGKDLTLSATPQEEHDVIYLGLYNQSDDVVEILASQGITLTIDPPILTRAELAEIEEPEADEDDSEDSDADDEEDVEESLTRLIQSQFGDVNMSGTALILLDDADEQRTLVVLAASSQGLGSMVNRLLDMIPLNADNALDGCLIQGNLALCPTNVAEEAVEAELNSDGAGQTASDTSDDEVDEPDLPLTDDPPVDINAVSQGAIFLNEPVEASLALGESHAWTFSEGPIVIDILLEGGEEFDGVLELYDPAFQLLGSSDSGIAGINEQALGIEIADDGEYTLVVREFFENEDSYVLSVTEGVLSSSGGNGVFIFADDDGEPLGDGFTSASFIEAELASQYAVTTWVSSQDGALSEDALADFDLVIWDSGDYVDTEGFFSDDAGVIFDFIDAGGNLLITGSSPTILGEVDLVPLSAVEIVGDDPILLDGFTTGEVVELDETLQAVLSDAVEGDDPQETVFMLRGPDEEGASNGMGLASVDTLFDPQQTAVLFFPLIALPESARTQLLTNLLTWFGI